VELDLGGGGWDGRRVGGGGVGDVGVTGIARGVAQARSEEVDALDGGGGGRAQAGRGCEGRKGWWLGGWQPGRCGGVGGVCLIKSLCRKEVAPWMGESCCSRRVGVGWGGL